MNYTCRNVTINSTFLNKPMNIIIALPSNYQPTFDYSTYLVFDGNDLLNNPNHNILATNTSNKVLIGISCDNNVERFNNWSTFHNQEVIIPMKKKYPDLVKDAEYLGGNGMNFVSFITKELLPFIKEQQQILIQDLNLLGCSMGAYFSLQLLYLSKLTFKKALLFSPSIWFNESIINDLKTKKLNNNQGLNVDLWVGLKEPKMFEQSFNVNYYQDSLKVKNFLTEHKNITINTTIDNNGGHGFKWWIEFINNHPQWW